MGDCFCFLVIASFIGNKSTNCLGLPEAATHKRLTVFALKIFKNNQNITKVETNILVLRSMQQRKWYLAEPVTTETCFAKKVF